jgi:ribose transport system substrate-binding protein
MSFREEDHVTTTTDTTTRVAPEPAPHAHRQRMFSPVSLLIIAVLAGLLAWQAGMFRGKPDIAIVTSGDGPYWDPVIAGAQDAANRNDVKLNVVRCKSNKEVQFDAIRNVVRGRPDGVAVSPLDPDFQSTVLADVAANTTLVTFDSDSPVSRRLCFVGTDNYAAGRLCGEAIKRAIPDGGDVVISLGFANKDNTQRRRQGIIDELLGRGDDPHHAVDPYEKPVKGDKYTIVATLADDGDRDKSMQLATEAIAKYPTAKCFVGLVSYSAPTAAEALKKANKLGTEKVVGFDVDERTLAGITAGEIDATVMQDQYGLGYHAVRILAAEASGNRGELPAYQVHTLPCKVITKENVAQVHEWQKGPMSGGGSPPPPTAAPASQPAKDTQQTASTAR